MPKLPAMFGALRLYALAAWFLLIVFAAACGDGDAAAPTATLAPTVTSTPSPMPMATLAPTATPMPVPTLAPTATPTPVPTPTAILAPAPTATPTPAPALTLAPTLAATAMPEPCDADGYCGVLNVGGALTAAAWLDDSRMYLAQYDGRIQLLNVDTGEVREVLDGLSVPQGLTALEGRLYVTDLGNLCELLAEMEFTESEINRCTADIYARSDAEMLDLFRQVSARVMSYRIRADGGIDQPRQVVGRILTSSRDHSANGLVNDGEWVYVSIGHPGHYPDKSGGLFAELEEEIAANGGRTDLAGTIARFRPPPENAEAEVEVWASGLRNTYGISIAPDGTIYGGDNDSQDGLADCCQREELNAIVPGGFYGFPYWGTNLAPPEAGVIEPAAVLEGTVSTFAHANESGVYVAYLYLGDAGGGLVIDRFEYETFRRFRIFSNGPLITAILEREGLLYLAAMSGEVHIIDPAAAPITARQ